MRRWTGAVGVALALVGTGCGDDGSDADEAPAPTEAAAEATPTEAPSDGCPYVTVEAVAQAFDQPVDAVELVQGDERLCDFDVDVDVDLMVTRIAEGWDGDDSQLASCDEGTRIDVAAGDGAYACLARGDPYAAVLRGDEGMWLGAPPSTEDALAVRDALAVLLPHVSGP